MMTNKICRMSLFNPRSEIKIYFLLFHAGIYSQKWAYCIIIIVTADINQQSYKQILLEMSHTFLTEMNSYFYVFSTSNYVYKKVSKLDYQLK